MSRRVWQYATVVWMGAILAGSLLPSGPGAGGLVWHLAGYAALVFLLRAWQTLVRAALAAWGYGVLIEGLQALTTYRNAEVVDLLANAGGVALGLLLAGMVRGRRT